MLAVTLVTVVVVVTPDDDELSIIELDSLDALESFTGDCWQLLLLFPKIERLEFDSMAIESTDEAIKVLTESIGGSWLELLVAMLLPLTKLLEELTSERDVEVLLLLLFLSTRRSMFALDGEETRPQRLCGCKIKKLIN